MSDDILVVKDRITKEEEPLSDVKDFVIKDGVNKYDPIYRFGWTTCPRENKPYHRLFYFAFKGVIRAMLKIKEGYNVKHCGGKPYDERNRKGHCRNEG